MSLQTIVKAGNITNLSDARYCAGMGVEIIGFPVEIGNSAAIELSKIKEITQWLSGIKVAIEFKNIELDLNYAKDIIQLIDPDYIQVPINNMEPIRTISNKPLIVVTDILEKGIDLKDEDYLLFSGSIRINEDKLKEYCLDHRVLLSGSEIESNSVINILKNIQPAGIELKGGTEISPGLKSFDELSDILELLEVE